MDRPGPKTSASSPPQHKNHRPKASKGGEGSNDVYYATLIIQILPPTHFDRERHCLNPPPSHKQAVGKRHQSLLLARFVRRRESNPGAAADASSSSFPRGSGSTLEKGGGGISLPPPVNNPQPAFELWPLRDMGGKVGKARAPVLPYGGKKNSILPFPLFLVRSTAVNDSLMDEEKGRGG